MVTLHRLSNHKVRICMYPDHAPPHFHVVAPDWSAMFTIDTLEMLRVNGRPPRSEREEVHAWANENKKYLRSKWERLNERDTEVEDSSDANH